MKCSSVGFEAMEHSIESLEELEAGGLLGSRWSVSVSPEEANWHMRSHDDERWAIDD